MKKSILHLSIAACLAVGAGLQLSAQTLRLRADIPFEFTVGETALPAGLCTIESTTTPGVLQIRSASSGRTVYLSAGTPSNRGLSDESSLSFHEYGGQRFLAGVSNGWDGTTFQFRPSRIEKEKALSARNYNTLTIVAKR